MTSNAYSFCLFQGAMPDKEFVRVKTNYNTSTTLASVLSACRLVDENFLCELGFTEQSPRLMSTPQTFPDMTINLNKTADPIFKFRNEGQADWFIFTCHSSGLNTSSHLPSKTNANADLMVIGEIGGLDSGSDVEMNQRFITSDMTLSASNLSLNFDRMIRMDE